MDINTMDKLKKLNNGQDVECSMCNNGHYRPIGGSYENCHHFKCDNCGEMIIATKKLKI